MGFLGSIRNDTKKKTILLFLGAIAIFAIGSAVLDRIWQTQEGSAARVLAWMLVYGFLGWAMCKQMGAALRLEIYAGLLILLALMLWIRFPLMSFQSDDYLNCLQEWTAAIRQTPGFGALGKTIGDYNVPYFYLLFAIAKLTTAAGELYWIKLISIAFGAVTLVLVMRIVSLTTKRWAIPVASMFALLLLPSLILNGSAWGQCDAIYTALCLAALYYGLMRRSKLFYLFLALAFSFKLQTVFFSIAVLGLLFTKRVRLRDAWVFFIVFSVQLLPALIAGRSLTDTLSIYYKQAEYYQWLHMNAPTIFGLFAPETGSSMTARAGIFTAGSVCFAFALYLYLRRDRLNTERILDAVYLSLLILPFLLPNMHERYFYAADVFGVIYFMQHPKRWYLPVVVAVSSLITYIPFLYHQEMALPLSVLSLAMLGVIGLVARDWIGAVEGERGCAPGEASR